MTDLPNGARTVTSDPQPATLVVARTIRAPFLALTPVCVFLGASTAFVNPAAIDLRLLILILAGALLAHISVNTLNEYHDFRSGLDFHTHKTPFSGGSGALPAYPAAARAVLFVGIAALTALLLIGAVIVSYRGIGIVPIGVAGILLIVSYTGHINRHPLACLVSPGIGFGVLMVAGTQFVLTGEYTRLAWLAATVPFFLVNNLLLLNQYPDIEADAAAGRNHLPIAYGTRAGNFVYASFALATVIVIGACTLAGEFPPQSMLALLPMPLAGYALAGAIKHGPAIGRYPKYLAANVAVAILVPLLLGLAIIAGQS